MSKGLYWVIEKKLAVTRRPESLDEAKSWYSDGIRAFVSLYNDHDMPPSIGSVEVLLEFLGKLGIKILHKPVPSGGVPPLKDGIEIVKWIDMMIHSNKPVAIGCKRAWGRGSAIAAAYLVYKGMEPSKAIQLVEDLARRFGGDPGNDLQRLYPFRIAKYLR